MKVDLFNDGTDTIKTISIDLIVNSVKQTGQTALAVNLPAGGVAVSYTHLRAHETVLDLVCRLLLEKKKKSKRAVQRGTAKI